MGVTGVGRFNPHSALTGVATNKVAARADSTMGNLLIRNMRYSTIVVIHHIPVLNTCFNSAANSLLSTSARSVPISTRRPCDPSVRRLRCNLPGPRTRCTRAQYLGKVYLRVLFPLLWVTVTSAPLTRMTSQSPDRRIVYPTAIPTVNNSRPANGNTGHAPRLKKLSAMVRHTTVRQIIATARPRGLIEALGRISTLKSASNGFPGPISTDTVKQHLPDPHGRA